jgi:hypothetical protein
MVPLHKKKEIAERENEYTSITESWHYKYWCGVPLGTPEEPINGSPALLKETVIDYHKMLEIILEAFEECGITWKFDELTIETGKVNNKVSPALPTPVFTKSNPNELDEGPDVPQARIRRCAICGERISPGEGVTYNRKLVHRLKCYEAAQAKWKESS